MQLHCLVLIEIDMQLHGLVGFDPWFMGSSRLLSVFFNLGAFEKFREWRCMHCIGLCLLEGMDSVVSMCSMYISFDFN